MKIKKNYAILIASTSLAAILLISLPQVYAADNNVSKSIVENKKASYTESDIQEGFPIPPNALKTKSDSNNPDLLVEKYELRGLKFENSIPAEYVTEIIKQGWKEIEEEQMGGMRVFIKDGEKVNIITQNGFFSILKETK